MANYIERYWRDATPQDAIKEPPMVARFRYEDAEDWEYDLLVGWDRTDQCHWRSELDAFEHCQVYDAPDPGEGWRLVDTENETKQEGDEYLGLSGEWRKADMNPFCPRDTYRRRIEPPKPKYVPFTWEDREQLRGRWIMDGTGKQEYTINDFFNVNGVLYICGHQAEHFLNWNWTFVDTGEPVGRKVVE